MLKIFNIIIISVVILCVSCAGEDRTHEYEELTQHNHWVYSEMKEYYLWEDTLKEMIWKSYFGTPESFLSTLTSAVKDKWSYVTGDSITTDPFARGYYNHYDSYGLDYVLMSDPTSQTNKTYLRIVTVYPDSPADSIGLQRGDFIVAIDSVNVTQSNVDLLQSGASHRLTVCHLDVDLEENDYIWADTVSAVIGSSRVVGDMAFPIYNVRSVGGRNLGYLMCNRLTPGSSDISGSRGGDTRNRTDLKEIMGLFRQKGVNELILDLRLCNQGTLDMSCYMASFIVSPSYRNNLFARTYWNRKLSSNNSASGFDASADNLGLERVFILTSGYTRGAAEWLIHGLTSLMGKDKVILIGTATAGQNVMTQNVGSYPNNAYVLCPVVAYVADGAGNYNYASGLVPEGDNYIRETSYVQMFSYGSSNEALFRRALEIIVQ